MKRDDSGNKVSYDSVCKSENDSDAISIGFNASNEGEFDMIKEILVV